MTFSVQIQPKEEREQELFPALRIWKDDVNGTTDMYGPLVVLFLSSCTGIALSGQCQSQIGVIENWINYEDNCWVRGTVTLSSET